MVKRRLYLIYIYTYISIFYLFQYACKFYLCIVMYLSIITYIYIYIYGMIFTKLVIIITRQSRYNELCIDSKNTMDDISVLHTLEWLCMGMS